MLKRHILTIFLLLFIFLPPAYGQDSTKTAEIFFAMGKQYYLQGDVGAARGNFQQCLAINSEHKQAKNYLKLAQNKNTPEARKQTVQAKEESISKALDKLEEKQKQARKKAKEHKQKPAEEEIETIPPTEPGAWTLAKGKIYAEIYTKYYWNNSQFNSEGKDVEYGFDGRYDEIRTELKLEYGLTDRLTLLNYYVYKEARWKDEFRSNTKKALTEIWLGGKYRLFSKPFVCSLQTRIMLPGNYNKSHVPSLGRKTLDRDVKILTAIPLQPYIPAYAKFEFGFRARNKQPRNEMPYYFEFAYDLYKSLSFKITLDGIRSLSENGQIAEDYTKFTVGPVFKLTDNFNLEFGYGETFAGRNSGAGKETFLFARYTF